MFCSTVIPTVNRPTLAQAVESVLSQRVAGRDFEVVVVNDSGVALRAEPWRASERVRVIATERRERSVARNAGAEIARGTYLHFLDDDDVMLPGAIQAFEALAASNPDAVWLYGGYETVDHVGATVRELHPDLTGNIFAPLVAGESIPLQASFLRADAFFRAGAFDPAMAVAEDRDLGRRLALLGDAVAMAHPVSRIRVGAHGSTTDLRASVANDRRGREKALGGTGAYARARASAGSAYWRGRVVRAYVASALGNLRRGDLRTCGGRVVAGVAMSGLRVVVPDFWRGLTTRPGQG